MESRYQVSQKETAGMNTQELRANFLMPSIMQADEIVLHYTHYDRVIVGGIMPVKKTLALPTYPQLRADYFMERREAGIINVGGNGTVKADGKSFNLSKLDCLYIGKGVREIIFSSDDPAQPACYYFLSSPAHGAHPTVLMKKEEANGTATGSKAMANERTIYKYIHADGIASCQLVMGLTILSEGSVWNTMPAHTHERRMEAYFYFDVPQGHSVFHFMGEPTETRHLLMHNYDAVVSPPWSIHSGCGTSNYGFIWGMAGENYTYTDMDAVAITDML
ncbi:MAG TPA: 5-dehydro-4-deoxy-D-glucuronate isomerase [Chitinophagaceae bacterium]|nr:5-dehydro-4-deoxy-D-glucuronate isomerase [Chitinophagaceae bacterium]